MLATIQGCSLLGMQGYLVRVEVDIANGLPCVDIVGLPDTIIREARDRVRSAIRNSGLEFPLKRITVNLAPGDLRKEGSGFDLPIALGILAASGQLPELNLLTYTAVGELSLDGSILPVPGILPMVASLKRTMTGESDQCLIVPGANALEAVLVDGLKVIAPVSLAEAVQHLSGECTLPLMKNSCYSRVQKESQPLGGDLAEVKGQQTAKRALEVAAAGGHNILLIGSPGSGKTMLARRLPTILPEMSFEESIELTQLYSVAGLIPKDNPLITERPFRSPHHSASAAGIIGGGRIPKPGEISLATHGVLYLDELPEHHRHVLEALRQPLEDHVVTVSRVSAAITYPADFILVCSMNPCRCGFFGDPVKECICTPQQIHQYLHRISGPLLDRIDIHIEVPRLSYQDLEAKDSVETSEVIKFRVRQARKRQNERFGQQSIATNSRMGPAETRSFCHLTSEAARIMKTAYREMRLSARAHDRIIKISRTIADLSGSDDIEAVHVAEAVQYRSLDRQFWYY